MLIVFLALFVVYAATAPTTVVLEDDGSFSMMARLLGVAHPPGYPLYVLLTHPLTLIPVGSIALRAHLASALYGALGGAVLWWVIRAWVGRRYPAYVAALAFGFSRTFWSQSIIADVYTLNVLLFTSMMALAILYLKSANPRTLIALALVVGLGLSNHWPLVVLASPCLILLIWMNRASLRSHSWWLLPSLPIALLVGLLPYVWMVLRSQAAPELTFAGSITSWDGFRHYVMRGQYSDVSPAAGWIDKGQFALFSVTEIVRQFTPLGAGLAAVGLVVQCRRGPALATWAILLGILCTLAALILVPNPDFQLDTQAIFRVYPLVPYALMSIMLAVGVDWIASFSSRRADSWGPTVLCALAVGAPLIANFEYNDRRDYAFSKDFGDTFLDSFDEDAVVFTRGDFETFILQYFHYLEGVRPDITILHERGLGLALDGRLFHERVDPLQVPSAALRETRILAYVEEQERPVYFLQNMPQSLADFDYGLYKKVDPSRSGTTTLIIDDDLLAFYRRMVEGEESSDDFTRFTRSLLIGRMTRLLAAMVHLHSDPTYAERFAADLEAGSSTFPGLLARVTLLAARGGATDEQLLAWIERAEAMSDAAVTKSQRADVFLLKGRILRRLGRFPEARAALERSWEIFPHPANPADRERRQLPS